jgi:molecular chaperone HtpG
MKDGQDAIYYITGDGFAATRNSPHLEIFRKLDVEVLLMYDRVDEWVASMLTEFDGKPLRSVAKGGLDLGKLGEQVVKPDEITAETNTSRSSSASSASWPRAPATFASRTG